jgi:hypothetical protein
MPGLEPVSTVSGTSGRGESMDTMTGEGTVLDVRSAEADRAWARVGVIAAYTAAVGFFVTTVLYLLDAFDVLGTSPEYVQTSAGQLQDEATFWAKVFEHQHTIVWDVIARDVIGPIAFVALIVLGVALRRRASGDGPERQLMVTFLGVGGVISALASLLFLGNAQFWRVPWGPIPPGGETSVVAVGRATTAIDNLTTWPEAFGYLVLALGVWCVGAVVRRSTQMPSRLSTLARVTAAGLTVLAIATVWRDVDDLQAVVSLIVGAVLAPWVCLWLGIVFRRGGSAR